jgi:hypothetical protein
VLSYEMAPLDLVRLRRSITILAEMAMAAGAREVFTSVFGFPALTSMDQARAMERAPTTRGGSSAWPSTRSAARASPTIRRRGLVDQSGESFELPGLFVADGSILPTSIGVNSQVPIMSMATRIGWRLCRALPTPPRPRRGRG